MSRVDALAKKWYNWKMSKINQKPNWQSKSNEDDFAMPEDDTENALKNNNEYNAELKNSEQESSLDVNLIIACFQEKLSQLTTELVVKDATIRQLTNVINKMRGQK